MVMGQDAPTPDKRTSYNLGDVTKEQLSERLNTVVAISFFNTLKQVLMENHKSSDERHLFDTTSVSSELKNVPTLSY